MNLTTVIAYILSSLAVVFLTLPVHEFAHAFTASKLGDPTPRYQGRLTLNPFAHIDYFGAICILLFGFGWARPVQVESRYFKNPKWGMALTAAAGPLANIIMAALSMLLANTVLFIAMPSYFSEGVLSAFLLPVAVRVIYGIFYYIAQINIYLAVFNLVPIPPLDGSRVLFAFLPQKYYFKFMRYERYIFIGLLALIWIGVLNIPLDFLSNNIFAFVKWLTALPFKLFAR